MSSLKPKIVMVSYSGITPAMSVDLLQSMIAQGYSPEPDLVEMRDFVSMACIEYLSLDPGRSTLGSTMHVYSCAKTCLERNEVVSVEALRHTWGHIYSRLAYRDQANRVLEIMNVRPFLTFAEFADPGTTDRIYERSYKPQLLSPELRRFAALCRLANLGIGCGRTTHWGKPRSWIPASLWASGLNDEESWTLLGLAEERLLQEPQLPVIQKSIDRHKDHYSLPFVQRR